MLHSGYSRKKALALHLFSALTSVLGAVLVLSLSTSVTAINDMFLRFAAGNLLYIAGSDLIPELHKHTRIRQGILQRIGMILGMVSMYLLVLFLE